MKKELARGVLLVFFICSILQGWGQTVPVGAPGLEDYYRREQLLGQIDSNVSFAVRPLTPAALRKDRLYYPDGVVSRGCAIASEKKNFAEILPLAWQQQYNSDHPYGWNDGSMIRARGYETLLSAGVYAQYGRLSIQLKPEFVFAENRSFKEYPTFYGSTDIPERYGNAAYSKLSWGQSSIRLNFGTFSFGLSNENLWWGPGARNSLLMSNSAAGFKHLTLNTTHPILTSIGSVEGQLIAGRLEGSGFTPPKPDDWRYLSGMVLTYQPKWVSGLFLGLTRSFQMYSKDMDGKIDDYFPLFQAFQKKNTNEGNKLRDQLTSLFARWVFKEAHAEVYLEYGLNDHSYNLRDFLGSPEHSRAYIFGMRKILPFRQRPDQHILVGLEITQMEQSIDRVVREAGAWYLHGQVVHGYTHSGEVLGAGIGPGSNLQSFDVSWTKGLKRVGLQVERYVHNNDFYYYYINNGSAGQWIDFSVAANGEWDYKNLLFSASIRPVQSFNYQWKSGLNGWPKENAFNLHGELGVLYRF